METVVEIRRNTWSVWILDENLDIISTYLGATGIKKDPEVDDRWFIMKQGRKIGSVWDVVRVIEKW